MRWGCNFLMKITLNNSPEKHRNQGTHIQHQHKNTTGNIQTNMPGIPLLPFFPSYTMYIYILNHNYIYIYILFLQWSPYFYTNIYIYTIRNKTITYIYKYVRYLNTRYNSCIRRFWSIHIPFHYLIDLHMCSQSYRISLILPSRIHLIWPVIFKYILLYVH
jgi:hypothetical protein